MNTVKAQSQCNLQSALPSVATTKSGVPFDPSADIWAFNDGATAISMRFSKLTGLVGNVSNSLKHVLLWYMENQSSRHAQNLYNFTVFLMNG